MRTVLLAITAVVAVGYSAPAFAQSRSYADCWAAAEKLGGPYGGQHKTYVERCMAGKGKVAGLPPPQKTTAQNRTEARTFNACWTLAQARIGSGGTHKTFIENCMAGKQN
jgi:hypothetical protein